MADSNEVMRRWECTRTFVVTKGKLHRAIELNLRENNIRYVGRDPDGGLAYFHFATVEAEVYHVAQAQTRQMLDELLAPTGVEITITDVSVRILRPGEEYLRR